MLRGVLPILVIGSVGCAGEIISDVGDGGNAAAVAARAAFERDVEPLLAGACQACHAGNNVSAVAFMVPDPDVYTSVIEFPLLVDLETPASSRLLGKGAHDGPAWTPAQATLIRAWIDLEVIARGGGPGEEIETEIINPIVGINIVDLASVGLAGTTLSFRAEKLSVGLYLSEIVVNAGLGGAHLVHPVFVTWDEGIPSVDPVDSFADVDMTVGEGTAMSVGGGTLVMVDTPPTAQISIHFELAESVTGGEGPDGGVGPVGGGCLDVASFTANARPTLSASCASCHAGGDVQAASATDMTRLNDLSEEGQASACAQILSRVNLANPPASGIFLAPDPGSGAGHPFKFGNDVTAFNGFRDALLIWIAAEQAARP
jgi:cytochrome c553